MILFFSVVDIVWWADVRQQQFHLHLDHNHYLRSLKNYGRSEMLKEDSLLHTKYGILSTEESLQVVPARLGTPYKNNFIEMTFLVS